MMSSSRRLSPSVSTTEVATRAFAGDDGILHKLLLAGCTALLAGRLLVPTEGTSHGDTLMFVQLWLGLALLWIWERHQAGDLRFSIDKYDVVVAMLAGGHVLSACGVLATLGDKRAALNLLWEWISLAVSFRLIRDVFRAEVERRNLVIVMLSVAVALAGFGIWQHHVWYAQTAAQYDKDRSELDDLERKPPPDTSREAALRTKRLQTLRQRLAEQGVDHQMQTGPGRARFEDRLKNSTEPFGKFALANTLGGFLLLWLLILAPLLFAALESRESGRVARFAILAGAAALVAYCLLLTKSRTAYVGLVAGMAAWRLSCFYKSWPSIRQILVWAGCGTVLALGLTTISLITGGIDRLVLAEAPKSLEYRLEYWRGSWGVIQEHPLLGSGPGNFRQHYLRHKLPQSSEEISDPHDLFLDVWANGGLLGLAGLIGLVAASWGLLRKEPALNHGMSAEPSALDRVRPGVDRAGDGEKIQIATSVGSLTTERPVPMLPRTLPAPGAGTRRTGSEPPGFLERRFNPHPVMWGCVVSFVVLCFGEYMLDQSLVALGLATITVMALFYYFDCVRLESLPARVWGAGLIGLMVHLLGAGGVGMPAVTQCLLLALALGIPAPTRVPTSHSAGAWRACIAGLVALAAFIGCLLTATGPVLRRATLQALGDDAVRRNLPFWESSYRRAAEVDPLSSEPWERLAEETLRNWESSSDADRLIRRAIELQQEAIQRDPMNFAGYRSLGNCYLMKFRKSRSHEDARLAAESLAQAVARYPHNSAMLAELAEAELAAGRPADAAKSAHRAVELDQLNRAAGHTDRYLPDVTRQFLESVQVSERPADTKSGSDSP